MLSTAAAGFAGSEKELARLREIIGERSIRFGRFRLASGGESHVFVDMKMTLLEPEGLSLASEVILRLIDGDHADAVGGLVLGACPIVDAVCLKSHGRRPIKGFYVRKEPKSRGTRKMIEGPLEPGSRVVLVEDVTTSGGSALMAVEAVRALGCQARKVVTVVDRGEGAEENLRRHDVELVPLFSLADFVPARRPGT